MPGAAVATCAADVANQADCERAAQTALGRWGRIDVLVQAAGIVGATNVTTDKVDPANFDLVMRINVRGIFLMCRAVLPAMRRQKYGRIVNVASISGKEGNAGMLAYSTSKAAVIVTKVIGMFAEGSGSRATAWRRRSCARRWRRVPAVQGKQMTDKIPMKAPAPRRTRR